MSRDAALNVLAYRNSFCCGIPRTALQVLLFACLVSILTGVTLNPQPRILYALKAETFSRQTPYPSPISVVVPNPKPQMPLHPAVASRGNDKDKWCDLDTGVLDTNSSMFQI